MERSGALTWLVIGVVAMAIAASAAGVFGADAAAPFAFTTLHGETVQMHGGWPYRHDTALKAGIQRGTDVVTLFVGLPLLVLAAILERRGSLRARLVLAGLLSYFLYNAASLALGTAYNELHLVYIAYLSVTFFAFLAALSMPDTPSLADGIRDVGLRRGISAFLFVAGGIVAGLWLSIIVAALVRGVPPDVLDSYTTEPMFVFDLALVVPTMFLAGVLVLRRVAFGSVLAAVLLVFDALVGIMVTAQTLASLNAGIRLGAGEFVTYVGPFLLMSAVAASLAVGLLRGMGRAAGDATTGGSRRESSVDAIV